MKTSSLISAFILLCVISISIVAETSASAQKLVLVSASTSAVEPLSMLEIRQLYLGLSIIKHETRLVPYRNYSDKLLKQMFLQKVVFLSSKTYERQLLRRTFGTGSRRPKVFKNDSNLVNALKRQRGALTIMWRSKAISTPGLVIVQEL